MHDPHPPVAFSLLSSQPQPTASLSFCYISQFYSSYSSFASLLIVFTSFFFYSPFFRTFGEGFRAAARLRHHSLVLPLRHPCFSYTTKTHAKQLDWPFSPVVQPVDPKVRLEVNTTTQRSALESRADNLDGLSSRSNTLQPAIAGRDGNLKADEDRHTDRACLDIGGVAGALSPMRVYPWEARGEHDMDKASVSQPQVSATEALLIKNTDNVANGKRKRSIGHDGTARTKLSPVPALNNLAASLVHETNTLVHTSKASPSSYFSSVPITDNGPTPPMSPATSPSKQELVEEPAASTGSLSTGRLETLKRALQTQIGLEILVKHNELRLIDQELAKCQIAYEQLRRCTEIPYPETRLSYDTGTAVRLPAQSASGGPLPCSPSPWGIPDGPYARHYAKWLLPDSGLEGGDESLAVGQHSEYARSTRGKPIETFLTAGKRGNKSKTPVLPCTPRDKSGPMIIKRKSDGKWVKLRCLDCARDDFGSAQGFINHCRIQHHRSFTSHDAAAAACGEVVEVDSAGAVVGAPLAQPAVLQRTGAVHPLIRSAHLIKPSLDTLESTQEIPTDKQTQTQDVRDKLTVSTNVSTLCSPKDFQASPHTPNLSALIRDRGLGINVQDLVTDAKSKAPVWETDDSATEMDIDTPTTELYDGQHPHVAGSKQPAGPRQPRKGGKTSSFGQLRGGAMLPSMHTALLSHESSELELEPSPTNESNQAPSLVDDDEDDEYEGHSPTSSSDIGEDDSEVDFHIEDDDVATSANLSPLYPDSGKSQVASIERRPSAFRRRFNNSREEKHVSFVSPSPARDMSGHDTKRRKL